MNWIYRSAANVALVCLLGGAATVARAQSVRFEYRGGSWSSHRHAGWHRYWGGPSIGFYYAPAPVYVVPGYDDPYYYTGPDYWYSNPSFGLSFNFGGGGHDRDDWDWGGRYRYDRDRDDRYRHDRDRDDRDRRFDRSRRGGFERDRDDDRRDHRR